MPDIDPEKLAELTPEHLALIGMTPEEFDALDHKGQARAREAISDKLAKRRAQDPEAGHKRFMPGDMSGQDPTSAVFTGQIAPKLAGDRAKAQHVLDRVKSFIDKYADMGIEKLGGASARKDRLGNVIEPGIRGREAKIPKEKVMKLVDSLPTMPSSQMMQAVRAIGAYVWRVHATFREIARVNKKLGAEKTASMGRADRRAHEQEIQKQIDEFETDSVQIKGDLNLLASAAGELRRSAGGGSKADQTFLKRVGGGWGKAPDVKPQEPTVKLTPDLKAAADYEPEGLPDPDEKPKSSRASSGSRSSSKSSSSVQAKGPTIRKKVMPVASTSDEMPDDLAKELGIADSISRPFDRWINEVFEVAAADRKPHWTDDI